MSRHQSAGWQLPLHVLHVSNDLEESNLIMQDLCRKLPGAEVRRAQDVRQLRAAITLSQPDLALIEANLDWAFASDIIQMLRTRAPECAVLVVWDAGADGLYDEAIVANLDGFVLFTHGKLQYLAPVVALALRRYRTQRAMREVETRYRSLFDNVPVGIYRTLPGGQILDANRTLVEMLRYPSLDVLLAVNAVDLYVTPEDRERWQARLRGGDTDSGFQVQLRRFDDTLVWVDNNTRIVRDEHQQVLFYEGTLKDITQRKQAERALRASEERFRTIIDQSPISIQVMTPDGWTVQVNRAWEKLWGITAADVSNYNMLHDEQAAVLGMAPYLRRGFSGESVVIPPVAYDTPETLKTGRKRWFQARIYPVLDERREIRNVIMMYEDITEHRWAAEDLQRLSIELMNSQESERKRISQDLHDDLGQALTAIRINLAGMERDLAAELSPLNAERLGEASMLVEQMLEHVRDLSHDLRPPMLDELGLVPTLRWFIKRQITRLGIDIEFETLEMEDRLAVDAETVLYRAVQEAFTNIARHARARRVKVRLLQNHTRVVLSIEDDGSGFDMKKWTADLSAGAGLFGMRERVARAGGTLALFSRPGQGTRLSIELPLVAAVPGGAS